MSTDLRATSILKSNQSSTDRAETLGRVKAPTFRVQTGVRAGGWRESWAALTPEQQRELADDIF